MSITKPVVIILGAGASAEYGFPLGSTLIKNIEKDLQYRFDFGRLVQGNPAIFDALRQQYPAPDLAEVNARLSAANELAGVVHHYPSIDEAIHLFSGREDVVEVGKLAIARSIIAAEQNCEKLKGESGASKVYNVIGWMPKLFTLLVGSLTRDELATSFANLTIVNFNYDRSIEHYLFAAIQSLGVKAETAVEILKGVKFIRPYGSLGELVWQNRAGVAFGASRPDLFKMAGGIRTYTERGQTEGLLSEIQNVIGAANVVMVLGFGFHKQNLDMLQLNFEKRRRTFATVFSIDSANFNALDRRLSKTFMTPEDSIELADSTCEEFLAQRSHAIDFAINS